MCSPLVARVPTRLVGRVLHNKVLLVFAADHKTVNLTRELQCIYNKQLLDGHPYRIQRLERPDLIREGIALDQKFIG